MSSASSFFLLLPSFLFAIQIFTSWFPLLIDGILKTENVRQEKLEKGKKKERKKSKDRDREREREENGFVSEVTKIVSFSVENPNHESRNLRREMKSKISFSFFSLSLSFLSLSLDQMSFIINSSFRDSFSHSLSCID